MNGSDTPLISVVVCTHNRGEILRECLHSLTYKCQTVDASVYQVIIIDNNSTDNTPSISQEFTDTYAEFSYYCEPKTGLSYARNRGYQEANTPWVGYIDDDAKAHGNYIERALWIMNNYDFDAFGGQYLPWYKYGKPLWIPEHFGTNGRLLDTIGVLPEGNISGGISFFKRHTLQEMGGFSTKLGMSGKKMSYGEETLLLVKMRRAGYVIGFDPDLNIDHLVNTYKLSPWWIIKSSYKRGLYYWQGNQIASKETSELRTIIELLILIAKKFVKATWKLPNRNYYWQNWIIDTFSEPAVVLGKLVGEVS